MSLSLKNRIVSLRKEGKTYDEIVDKLGCSKSTVSYHCNNSNIDNSGKKKIVVNNDLIMKINEYYQNHTGDETAKKFGISRSTVIKYCDNKSGETLTDEERKRKNVEYVQRRRHKIKEMAIEYKGGCCQCCGYDKSKRALEFHHIDPTEKDFNISHKGHSRSWKRVKKELDKCILVCSNCHAEIHDDLIKIKKYDVRVRMSDDLDDNIFLDIISNTPKQAIILAKNILPEGKCFKCEYMWLFESGEWGNMTIVT